MEGRSKHVRRKKKLASPTRPYRINTNSGRAPPPVPTTASSSESGESACSAENAVAMRMDAPMARGFLRRTRYRRPGPASEGGREEVPLRSGTGPEAITSPARGRTRRAPGAGGADRQGLGQDRRAVGRSRPTPGPPQDRPPHHRIPEPHRGPETARDQMRILGQTRRANGSTRCRRPRRAPRTKKKPQGGSEGNDGQRKGSGSQNPGPQLEDQDDDGHAARAAPVGPAGVNVPVGEVRARTTGNKKPTSASRSTAEVCGTRMGAEKAVPALGGFSGYRTGRESLDAGLDPDPERVPRAESAATPGAAPDRRTPMKRG